MKLFMTTVFTLSLFGLIEMITTKNAMASSLAKKPNELICGMEIPSKAFGPYFIDHISEYDKCMLENKSRKLTPQEEFILKTINSQLEDRVLVISTALSKIHDQLKSGEYSSLSQLNSEILTQKNVILALEKRRSNLRKNLDNYVDLQRMLRDPQMRSFFEESFSQKFELSFAQIESLKEELDLLFVRANPTVDPKTFGNQHEAPTGRAKASK